MFHFFAHPNKHSTSSSIGKSGWCPIPGYEGLYEASTSGLIRSISGYPRVLKARLHKSGYLTVTLCNRGLRKTHYCHRLIASTFLSNPQNLTQVNHIDGVKTNNELENLEWVSHAENIQHAYENRLFKGKMKFIVDLDTGEIYWGLKPLSKHTGIPYSTCKNVLSGKQKSKTLRIEIFDPKGKDFVVWT